MGTWYRTGTIAVTNGSKNVTGTGTQWVENAVPGCILKTDDGMFEVDEVISATSITLVENYTGSTASGLAYAIIPTQGYIPPLSRKVNELIEQTSAVKDAYTNNELLTSGALEATDGAEKVGTSDGRTVQDRFDDLLDEVDAAGTAQSKVASHNADANAHPAMTEMVTQAADRSESAADRAETSAANAQASSRTVQTWTDLSALTPTVIGEGAEVLDSDTGTHTDPSTSATVANAGRYKAYDTTVGAWTWIGDTGLSSKLSVATFDAQVGNANPALPSRVPVYTAGTKVPLWLDDGLIGARGVIPELGESITAPVAGLLPEAMARSAVRAPLVRAGGKFPLWLDDGALGFTKVSPSSITYLAGALGGAVAPPAPVASDGSTLRRYRAQTAKFRSGVANTHIRVGFTGDSWTEKPEIAAALLSRLNSQYLPSASGYVGFGASWQIGGVSLTRTGWTVQDTVAAGGRSLGPDMFSVWSSGTTDSLAATGIVGTQITLAYWDGNGAFRYRIDGGGWTSVAGGGTNTVKTTQVTGLSAGTHSLDIDTAPNTGTAELYFALAESPSVSGVTMMKFGNGGSTGLQWTAAKSYVQQWSSLLALDLMIVILGTNDTRVSVPTSHPATLAQGIEDIVEANRQSNADLPVIYIFPPAHGEEVGPESLEEYRAAAEARCTEIGIECYRSYAEWDDYATESARGMWASGDLYHLSVSGADRLDAGLHHNYLEI